MITTRVQIGLTGINFYAANGSTSSGILNDSNGNLNIIGSTGSFKEISGITGIFNNILTTKIGAGAGAISQGANTVAFGNNAGNNTQGNSSVAIGNNAGSSLQGSSSVAIGDGAGASKQSQQSVAIGNNAGYSDQSQQSVAIGYGAGKTTQEIRAVAIGYNAGNDKQGSSSVAIGDGAGMHSQCENSVAIGSVAGYNYQGTGSIAIGNNAGSGQQNPQAIAIGVNAGSYLQGTGSIAIGLNAGLYNQGKNSIAIGNDAGPTGMSANTIILNASGTALYYTGPTGGFFVAPIQTTSVVGQNMILGYGPDKQIIGLTGDALAQFGIGSSTGTSSDPFLLTNFINPPSVPDSLSVTSSSSDIYVIYNYPKQTNFGIGLLPVISSLNIIVGNTGTSNFTGFTGTSSDFIKSTSTSNVVECINISKQGTEGLGNRNGKRMYTIRYPNLPNTDPNPNFYLWYANSSLSKSMYSTYLSYINSGLPSQPILIGRPSPPTINSIPFMFKGSDKIDTVDPTSSADLRFNIYYAPLSNTKRYGGPVGVTGEYKNSLIGPSSTTISYNTSGNFFNVTGNTGLNYSGTITSAVYPDTIYSVDVNASNSISSGFTGISLGNFTTQSSLPPTFVSSGSNLVSLSSGLISGRSVIGSTLFTNILPPNISSSFTQTFPIHNTTDSRGATGTTPLVTFTSSVTGPAGTITGPSASYTGFGPSYVYGTNSAGNINMTLSTPTDVTGLAGYDGYYLRGNVTTAMSTTLTNGLAASAMPYALSVTGTYSSNNSAVSTNYYAPFYYDGQQTPAIIGTPSLSVVNGNTGAVCGVPVSKGPEPITLRLATTVSGLGNNFYFNGNILTYAPTTGILTPSSETTLGNLTSGTISSGTFTNSALLLSLSSFLKLTGLSSLKITTTATNLYAASTSVLQSNGVNILYDHTSFTLANTTFISTTSVLSSYSNCYRLLSTSTPEGCFATPNNIPSNYLYSNLSYSNNTYALTKFDNTRSIKDDTDYKSDLIISNGICTSDTSYYIDYGIYGGPNYSSITKNDTTTRYATFAWKVDTTSISGGTNAYNYINFKLGNTSSMLFFSSDGSVYTDSGVPSKSKFLLYYRLEDTANLNSTGTGWTTLTSPWIDGNSYDASGAMYPVPGANTTQTSSILKGLSVPFTTNTTNTIFKVKIPNPISNTSVTSSTNLYIYCRVGLNMFYPFSFNNIQALLSTL